MPPEVNQSYIVDFAPRQSLVRTLLDEGFKRVAVIEWLSANAQTKDRDIDDSLHSILDCVKALGGKVHLIGLCQGGWESIVVAALEPQTVSTLTLVASPVDFHAGDGLIKLLSRIIPLGGFQALVEMGGGVMKGELISAGFDNLLPLERYFVKYLAIWNHLDDDRWMTRFHRMNDWYRCPKDLPGRMYLRSVRELFKENRLIQGQFVALGRTVDLSRIECPLVLVAGKEDHITPPPQVWAAKRAVGSKRILEVEMPGGHVGTFMGTRELKEFWPAITAWLQREAARRA